MRFIDPTLYASQRSLPELELLAAAGAMAIVEPVTWQGLDRRFAETYCDEFERLMVAEARRALSLRLGYAACLGVPAREAGCPVARRVVELMPRFLGHERVAGIGEVGLEHGSEEEAAIFRAQARLARHHRLPLVVRLPERDRPEMLARLMTLLGQEGVNPGLVLFNGVRDDELPILKAAGCWFGLSVGGPEGLSVDRVVHVLARVGPLRAMVNSAAGRMGGDLLAVPRTARAMLSLGFAPELVEQVIYHNPKAFFSAGRPLALVESGRVGMAGARMGSGDRMRAERAASA